MKWKPTKEVTWTEGVGFWNTKLGKVKLSCGFNATIYADVPKYGRFMLSPNELIKGLAEVIPELKD